MSKTTDFEQFFKDNYQSLFHFALQMVGDDEVCRDLVGEAMAVAWRRMDEIGMMKLKSFTYKMVHNKCIDHLRHEKAKARYAEFYRTVYDEGDEDILLETERQIENMMALMDTLPPRTREVLHLCYFKRKKYGEVANELDISRSAVHKHIMKALKAFRAGMAKKSK